MDELFNSALGGNTSSTSKRNRTKRSLWSPAYALTALAYLYLVQYAGEMVRAQPPTNLDPAATEAIIAAFMSDATDQQRDDEEVNNVLEQILQQDAEPGGNPATEPPLLHQAGSPAPVPFHGPNSPISTPTQPDEEEEEEDGEADPEVHEPPPVDP